MNREDIIVKRKNLDGTWINLYPETKAELVEGAPPKTLTISTENSIEIDGHTHKFLLDGTLISGAKIGYYENSIIIDSDTNQVDIGIIDYDKDNDLLIVHINSVFIKNGTDYEIIGSESIKRLDLDNWEAGSIIDFLVIKNIEYNYPSDHVIKQEGAHEASAISLDTSLFSGNLNASIDDIQKLAEAVDGLNNVGGFSTMIVGNEKIEEEKYYYEEEKLVRKEIIVDNEIIKNQNYFYYENNKISRTIIESKNEVITETYHYNEKLNIEKIERTIKYL